MDVYVVEKSDSVIILMKRPNKGRQLSAEAVEGRTLPEGNSGWMAAVRTQCRVAASTCRFTVRCTA
jgi:hypothetical protein